MTHHSVLVLGCGNMGGALLARWARLVDIAFTVLDPALPALPEGVGQADHVDSLAEREFDALILAVKPQVITAAAPAAAALLKPGGVVISIAAGAGAARISNACGGAPVIRLMPNMPARVGLGVSGLFAQPAASAQHRAFAARLAQAVGQAIWVAEEDAIDRITAAAGSGPGYVFEFARTYQNAVQDLGFSPDDARELVLKTVLGAMMLADDADLSFEALRTSITSEGGTTAAGLAALNGDDGLSRRLQDTLNAAYDRAAALRAPS